MRDMMKAMALFGALLASACNGEKCDTESCGDWGGSSSKSFLTCIGGNDLILRDPAGSEIFRCDDSAGASGGSSSCPDDFANAKANYCAQ
jgi:hypothetical protein